MMKMQGSAKDLKSLVYEVHNKFHTTGGGLVSILNSLDKIQVERDQTRKLLEISMSCKDITKLMLKLKQQIESDEHYYAMRTIETIQYEIKNNLLISPMVSSLEKWLPVATNKLLYSARLDADQYILQLRDCSQAIGRTLLTKYAKTSGKSNNNENLLPIGTKLTISLQYLIMNIQSIVIEGKWNNPIDLESFIPIYYHINEAIHKKSSTSRESKNVLPPIDTKLSIGNISLSNINLEEFIDYSLNDVLAPLHKVLHLYAVLSNISSYHEYYLHKRNEFYDKIMKNIERNINSIGLYLSIIKSLEEIIGFFFIESIILHNVEIKIPLLESDTLNNLWEQYIRNLYRIIIQYGILLTSPNELLLIKEELVLILYIINDHLFTFNVNPLIFLIYQLWNEIFNLLLVQSLTQTVTDALSKSLYQPYVLNSINLNLYDSSQMTNIKYYSLDTVEITRFTTHRINNNELSDELGISTSLDHNDVTLIPNTTNSSLLQSHLSANLDALEEEVINKTVTFSPVNQSSRSLNTSSPVPDQSSAFIPRTFAFSEFVPVITQNLHGAIIQLFFFSLIKLPEAISNATNFDPILISNDSNRNSTKKEFQLPSPYHTPEKVKSNPDLSSSIESKETVSVYNYLEKSKDLMSKSLLLIYQTIITTLTNELSKDDKETTISKVGQILIDSIALMSVTKDTLWELVLQCSDLFFHLYNIHDQRQHAVKTTYSPGQLHEQYQLVYKETLEQVNNLFLNLIIHSKDLLFELLTNKINDLLESLQFIDYEPDGLINQSGNFNYTSNPLSSGQNNNQIFNLNALNPQFSHETIDSIIEFLKITFMCLTHLPQSIRESIYFIACSNLANGIINYLLSNKVQRINIFALISFDSDCKKLIHFADNCNIINYSLRDCFVELNETIRCLLSPDLLAICENPANRRFQFPHVSTLKLASILDKVKKNFL